MLAKYLRGKSPWMRGPYPAGSWVWATAEAVGWPRPERGASPSLSKKNRMTLDLSAPLHTYAKGLKHMVKLVPMHLWTLELAWSWAHRGPKPESRPYTDCA